MSPESCRELYVRASRKRDVAIVEGQFCADHSRRQGGSLELLCQWLQLPRVVILDVARLGDCETLQLPAATEALLLDHVANLDDLFYQQTKLEALHGIPVLGGLPKLGRVRQALERLPQGSSPSPTLCNELGEVFEQHAKLGRLLELADRRYPFCTRFETCLLRQSRPEVRIAVAYDSAFNSYFHDTLDQLELYGAEIVTFSPLTDERLPDCDIVYIGAGQPEQFTDRLNENQCMMASLRSYYRRGGRLYAEGAGLAYLCQEIETADGRREPMVGALPAIARQRPHRGSMPPVEITTSCTTWLAQAGTRIRGYANPRWELSLTGHLRSGVLEPQHSQRIITYRGLVGSLVHIHFAAQPCLMGSFFAPWPHGALATTRSLS
jgi:cobyrinic acid a,c-diamide synthase